MKHLVFKRGLRDGIPSGLGYVVVSIGIGIACRTAKLGAAQGFFMSLLNNASAGEYGGITVITENSGVWMMILMTLIINARYMLMSCALSQHLAPDLKLRHRLLLGFYMTDEFFGISMTQRPTLDPCYTYGAISVAAPCWAVGTALGILAGSALPLRVTSALSVALYGMFLAIIVPPGRENRVLAGLVPLCFALSFACSRLPVVSGLSEGTRTILLTVLIASAAALLFPVKDEEAEYAA